MENCGFEMYENEGMDELNRSREGGRDGEWECVVGV